MGHIPLVPRVPNTKDVPANSSLNMKKGTAAPAGQNRILKKENKVDSSTEESESLPPPAADDGVTSAAPGAGGGRFSPKIGSRRSFSLDEASLLNYSTSIPDSIESVESSLQSAKRREECLRIYDKMKRSGCVVRLHTIFR